jgi:hypothetical protein
MQSTHDASRTCTQDVTEPPAALIVADLWTETRSFKQRQGIERQQLESLGQDELNSTAAGGTVLAVGGQDCCAPALNQVLAWIADECTRSHVCKAWSVIICCGLYNVHILQLTSAPFKALNPL